MSNPITTAFHWLNAWLHLSLTNPHPSKVCGASEENVKPEPLRSAMKPCQRFAHLVRNRGPPIVAADLRAVEDRVKVAFGGCTRHPNLLGGWTNELAIYALDLILLLEFPVANSPSARWPVQGRHNVRLCTDYQVFRFFVHDPSSN